MITKKCKVCGKEFKTYPSVNRQFCSQKCANSRQTEKMNATRVTFVCEQCGKTFTRTVREVRNAESKGYSIRFCSKKCKSDNWGRNRIKVKCYVCGKEFLVQKKDCYEHKTCSPECAAKNEYNRMRFPKLNPSNMYIIRKSSAYARWRRAIEKRDKGICQQCPNELGLPTQIHHKIPLYDIAKKYDFDVQTVLKSPEFNDLNNGITLCTVCHAKAHPENVPMQKALEYETYLKQSKNLGRPRSTTAEGLEMISAELSGKGISINPDDIFWNSFWELLFGDLVLT